MAANPNSLLALYCGLYQAAGHWFLLVSNFARGHLAFNEIYELKVALLPLSVAAFFFADTQGDRTRAAKSPLVRFEADILAAGRGLHFNPGLCSLLSRFSHKNLPGGSLLV